MTAEIAVTIDTAGTAVTADVADTADGSSLYVDALHGDDNNEGGLDCPLRTIEEAKRRVRSLIPGISADLCVYLRGGVYRPSWQTRSVPLFNRFGGTDDRYPLRESGLIFGEEDSGRNGHQVVYRSYPGERAVISGGRRIEEWECCDEEKRIYRAFVGTLSTRQLYVNGRRAQRARSDRGFLGRTEFDPECRLTGGPAYITDDPSPLSWRNPGDVELVYPNSFTMSRCTVDRVEPLGNRTAIYMKQPGFFYITHKYGTSAKLPSWIENDPGLLRNPGEWCLDSGEGLLYYIPLPEEDMGTAEAVVPTIDVLLSVRGSSSSRKAGRLTFRSLDFEYAGWLRPNYANGHCDSQNNYIRESIGEEFDSDHQSDAAVEIEYADDVTLEDCRLTKLGITALRITKASCRNRIEGCEIADVSGGGISIGDPEFRNPENRSNCLPEEADMISDNRIVGNYLHDIGLEYRSATAISATFTRNTEIRNNEICRVPYSALHIGYGWDVPDVTCTRGMSICRNVVDTFMTTMFDGGGMYFIGATGGTREHPNVISNNYIRNQVEPKYGGFYFDEGSSDWQADGNVFEKTELWCNISGISRKLHDIAIANTWIDQGYCYMNRSLGQAGVEIEEPQRYPRRNWPEPVEAVIRQAGLPPAYAHLRPDYDDLGEVLSDKECLLLEVGGERVPGFVARTVRGVRIDNLADAVVHYSSDDDAIATADSRGMARGIAPGRCRIRVTVERRGIVKSADIDVYVGDSVVGRHIELKTDAMLPGASQRARLVCRTSLGRSYVDEEARFHSDRPEVLRVDPDGKLTAAAPGQALLRAEAGSGTGTGEGENNAAKGASTEVRVCGSPDPAGRFVRDPAYWSVSPDMEIANGPGLLRAFTEGGIGTAVYRGRAFGDERLRFGLLLEAADNELVCLYLRSRQPSGRAFDADNAGYVMVIAPKGIELHRFRDRQRTQLFGNVYPYPALAGDTIPNAFIRNGQPCCLETAAVNEADGVRLTLRVDGKEVFAALDRWDGCIREPGYFGLTVTRGSITLREPPNEARDGKEGSEPQ
ncbi:right-handed parallel beta-helix repeat-containing protein [Cohnella fermenti]|uniref:Right-handed parallel beta-helix repeat-containing protein n=1 Tax=Cohnella fermenti TaxID=2565925 RepID=A0A4S4BYK1_9BACL|nr:right-handed parallel beta-helix repeat-containing protein [Cohnella fermenti]THF80344.1 right-handed parallel beta-helix repeat-containing protein [Cohnella fermenti]